MTKITRIKMKNGNLHTATSVELDAVVEQMSNDNVLNTSEQPLLVFSATFGKKGFDSPNKTTDLLLMSTEEDTPQQIRLWLNSVEQIPYTVLAFRSIDRRQLHVVARIARADGSKSDNTDDRLRLLQRAQQQLTTIYQSLTGCRMLHEEYGWLSGCMMSYDPERFYQPEAQPFPVVMRDKSCLDDYRGTRVYDDGGIDISDDVATLQQQRLDFYTCLKNALELYPSDQQHEQLIITLAEECQKAGLDEEASVQRTLYQSRFRDAEDLVRKIFRTTYAKPYKGKVESPMNQKERIALTIRDFFERRYMLRYNEVKQVTEFRPKGMHLSTWRPLDDRELKRIAFEEMLEGGHGWMIDIELYVGSSLVRRYNPIHEFLAGVGQWDGQQDYIEEYARRLKTDYDQWPHYFHRWFLAMVAQALNKNRDYGNSMVPLLIGTQAMKKSTFCKNILPYSLREYYMDDIKMDNAEQVERVLGRMWLVNIDEYNAKTEREQAKIKRLLTEKDIQVRKMRSDQYTMTPRLCSFIATTNDRRPLTDPTGSRRYLCVEMEKQADMSGTINYRQMYAQALWEIDHGHQYWFDNDDERAITAHNARYQLRTSLDDVLTTMFQPADNSRENFMTTTDVQRLMRRQLTTSDVPTLAKLGRALHRQHYPEGALNGIHGYYLKERQKE